MKNYVKTILFYLLLFGVVLLLVLAIFRNTKQEKLKLSDMVGYFKDDRVVSFVIDEKYNVNLTVIKVNGDGALQADENGKWKTEEVSYKLRSLQLFEDYCGPYVTGDADAGIAPNANLISYEIEPETTYPWWVSLIPYLILLLLIVAAVVFFVLRSPDGHGSRLNSFGKARTKTVTDGKDKVTFADVAGADEEKQELEEIVDFLKDPRKFTGLGAKIPHGVLLMGPPGTGKTLLAKAVAGEAGVPFYSISGSDFVEMYVGVGASRVRDLFETARKSGASIVFIDEIDAVGRHRGAGLGGGHDEREQTLNQLLVEMDGFGSHDGIIVMAATNRPDILDPALLRPGRFDRQITVGLPDIKGRVAILKVHSRNKPLEAAVDLDTVAKKTVGFTGADLANLMNEAALLAARRGKTLIGMDDIDDAFIRVIAGTKKARVMSERERKNTAYHEAGHAVVGYLLPTVDPVNQISIVPSGRALGYTLNLPTEDKYSVFRQEMKEEIAMMLAGRVAEKLVFGDISGGASNDIKRATGMARQMVTQLGMSDVLGPVLYGSGESEIFLGRDFSSTKDYSEEVAAKIDAEIKALLDEGYATAEKLLTEHRGKLDFVAAFLLKNEIMDGDQFKAAMEGDPTVEELEAMAEEKKRKSRDENEARAREKAEAARKAAEGEDDGQSTDDLPAPEESADENAGEGDADERRGDGKTEESDKDE